MGQTNNVPIGVVRYLLAFFVPITGHINMQITELKYLTELHSFGDLKLPGEYLLLTKQADILYDTYKFFSKKKVSLKEAEVIRNNLPDAIGINHLLLIRLLASLKNVHMNSDDRLSEIITLLEHLLDYDLDVLVGKK